MTASTPVSQPMDTTLQADTTLLGDVPPIVQYALQAGFKAPRHEVRVHHVQPLTDGVIEFAIIDPYIARHAQAGQFINLYSHDDMRLMPRPFGVAQVQGDVVSVIFAVVGEGTEEFSHMRQGDTIDVLGPLGKPYAIDMPAHYVLVGGGLGVPPLIRTAQLLRQQHAEHTSTDAASQSVTTAVLGYRNVHFADSMMQTYADQTLSIDDSQGNVIDVLQHDIANHISVVDSDESESGCMAVDEQGLPYVLLSCGPHGMMKAVAHWAAEHHMQCQLSLEQRMGCGYGTCVVCTVDTAHGRLKVCNDGPVFTREELGWN